MSALEILNLFITVATASCLIIRPALINRMLNPIVAILVLLSCLQLFISGYSWRYFTGYLLISVVALWALIGHRINTMVIKRILQFALFVLLPLALLPWSVFRAVPRLPQPMGPNRLGTKVFRWIDLSRAEENTPDTLDRRNVVVQAWYPREPDVKGRSSVYLDGLGKLPNDISMIPSAMFDRYDQIDTHALTDAPISSKEVRWPVVLFLTGNGASRAFYTSLITHIASQGYVVLAIDHPYDASISQLADGSLVTNVEQHLPPHADRMKFMTLRGQTRIADVKFVVDKLEAMQRSEKFFSQLDIDRIVIAGHSLGGASGAMAMAFDPRIKAAVNIDGTTYGELPGTPIPRPFLLIESKKDPSDNFLRYEEGNQMLFEHFAGGHRYELPDADHYSFTDAPLLLTWPARSLASRFLEVGNAPEQTYQSTAAMVAAFFSGALQGNRVDLDTVAAKYKGVLSKKPTRPSAQEPDHTER